MTFHQIIAACDPSHIVTCDEIRARVDYIDPLTGLEAHDEVVTTIGEIVVQDSAALRKADLVVGYAKALIVIGQVGDTLVFRDMAHYTMVKTSTFNGVRSPSIATWDPTACHLQVHRRFGYEDYASRLG